MSALDLEYYLHFSGRKEAFEIDEIYDRDAHLFERPVVDALRERPGELSGEQHGAAATCFSWRSRAISGSETKSQATELAEREASLEIELNGSRESYRQAAPASGQRARRPPRAERGAPRRA